MKRTPLPNPLGSNPFRVSDALEHGVTPGRLRSKDLDTSIWGVRGKAGTLDKIAPRCLALQLRLPRHAFFSHTTAALLLGAPLPIEVEMDPRVHVSVGAPAARLHSRSVVGHRLELQRGDVVLRMNLRQTSALRTWFDLATILDLDDLVAVGDSLIHWRSPMTSVDDLRARLESFGRRRGVALMRLALDLINDRPESRPESLLRLIVLRSGLPEPQINHVLVNTTTGKHVRPDFTFVLHKIILEYQGDYHRTRDQWRKDMTRRTRLEAQGWHVMELNADDLKDPTELTERIAMAMALPR